MVFVNTLTRGAAGGYKANPAITLRMQDDQSVRTSSATAVVGEIQTDLIPLRLTRRPLNQGGAQLTVRPIKELAFDARLTEEEVADYRDKTFTLEHRINLSNSSLQKVLFRGKVASEGVEYAPGLNGRTLYASEGHVFNAAPMEHPDTTGWLAGNIFAAFNNGYYITREWDGTKRSSTITPYAIYPWPTDRTGNPTAKIDPALLANTTRMSGLAIEGQPLAVAFSQIVERMGGGKYIPAIRYDGEITVLTAIEVGARKRTLVIGAPGKTSITRTLTPNTQAIQGTKDYANVWNMIVARGGYKRTMRPITLTKAWTAAEESVVLASASARGSINQPQYEHVGRLFRSDAKFWPMEPEAHGFAGTGTEDDRMRFWRRRKAEDDETQLEGDDWVRFRGDYRIVRKRADQDTSGQLLDRVTDTHPASGDTVYIEFAEPQFYEYFTPTQQTNRAAGTEQTANVGTYTVECQPVQIGDRLGVFTDHTGDYPGLRAKVFNNPDATSYNYTEHYTESNIGVRTTSSTTLSRDDTAMLGLQGTNIVSESSKAAHNLTVTLWYLDLDWEYGDKIDQLMTCEEEVLIDDPGWVVVGVDHDFQTWKTILRLSADQNISALRTL